MSYNNEGGAAWPMPWYVPQMCGSSGSGLGGGMGLVALLAIVFIGLLLLCNGGLFGNKNAQADDTAARAAAYVAQGNLGDKVSSTATGVDAVAGIATANGVKVETVKDLTSAGFAGVQRDMCSAFANAATLANSNHSDLTRQNTDLRFQLSQCCCDNKAMAAETQRQMADGFCRLSHQYESGNAAVLRAIADLGCSIERNQAAQRIAELEAKNAKLENNAQTAQLAALIQQQRGGCCSGCNPCCNNVCTQLPEALLQNWINKTLTPATTATGN